MRQHRCGAVLSLWSRGTRLNGNTKPKTSMKVARPHPCALSQPPMRGNETKELAGMNLRYEMPPYLYNYIYINCILCIYIYILFIIPHVFCQECRHLGDGDHGSTRRRCRATHLFQVQRSASLRSRTGPPQLTRT